MMKQNMIENLVTKNKNFTSLGKLFYLTLILLFIFALTSLAQNRKGTFKDKRDNKVYNTVVIGSQEWLAENLAYNAGRGTWAYDDNQANVKKYGYLYNYKTAVIACPNSWKLPSKNDWTILLKNYNSQKDAGYALDSKGSSGFNVSYGGFSSPKVPGKNYGKQIYSYINASGNYWTSDNKNYDSWAINFGNNPYFYWSHIKKGLSVRCIREFDNKNHNSPSVKKNKGKVQTKNHKSNRSQSLNNSNEKVLVVAQKMPEFFGGKSALRKYISQNLKYPERARKQGKTGRVFVSFVVRKDGSISNAKILKGVSSDIDAAAIELINHMPKWQPGSQREKAINIRITLPINFLLR